MLVALAGRLLCLFFLLASLSVYAANPQVEFETSRGTFVIELYPDKAPRTVENFLQYVKNGFYDGTVFHRAINHFVVQGGGLTEKLDPKPTRDPVPNESTNGMSNDYGTVAMARGYKPDSATSQFFVNLEDNRFLNYYRNEAGLEGYAVFGRVVRGLDVLIKMSEVATVQVGKLDHVPKELTVVRASRLLDIPVLAENAPPLKPPEPVNKKSQTLKPSKKGKKRG